MSCMSDARFHVLAGLSLTFISHQTITVPLKAVAASLILAAKAGATPGAVANVGRSVDAAM